MQDEDLDRQIQLIYNTVADPTAWQTCLADIAHTIGAKSGMIGIDDAITGTHLASTRYGFPPDMLQELQHFKDKDVWAQRLIHLNVPRFMHDLELMPHKDYLSSEIYNGFSRHADIVHTVGAYVSRTSDTVMRICWQRGASQDVYHTRQVDYLNRLLPHIKNALRLTRKLQTGAVLHQVNQSILDRLDHAALLVDSTGTLTFHNTKAESLLCQSNLITCYNHRLHGVKGVSPEAFRDALKSVTRTEYMQETPVSIPFLVLTEDAGIKQYLLIEISRFHAARETAWFAPLAVPPPPLALVTITNISRRPEHIEDHLKKLYQLSHSEADIALSLADGLSPRDIADKRMRSIETIRTQIKQITAKVGVSSTNALITHIHRLGR